MADRVDWLETVLATTGLTVRRDGGDVWVVVPSDQRGSVAVKSTCGERTVTFRTFVMRAPDQRHEDVYRRLLRRNDQAGTWAFSLDALGDVFLVANVPRALVDADTIDGLFGALSSLVDETFEGLARTGFAIPDDVSIVASPPTVASDEG